MIYTNKDECYQDVLISLTTGVIEEQDIAILREYYQDIEHYECCQGIIEAYVDYQKLKKEVNVTQGDQSES